VNWLDKWSALNLCLSFVSVLLTLIGVWLTKRSIRVMAQARKVHQLSETLVALWRIRQSILVSLAYNNVLLRQPRLTEMRGRALEVLLVGLSDFSEQKERFADEMKTSALKITEAVKDAEEALRRGNFEAAAISLNEAAKIVSAEVGKVRRDLDDALRGEV